MEICGTLPMVVNTHSLQHRGESNSMCISFALDFPHSIFSSAPFLLPTIGYDDGFVMSLAKLNHISQNPFCCIFQRHRKDSWEIGRVEMKQCHFVIHIGY